MGRTARDRVDPADLARVTEIVAKLKARRLDLGMSQAQVAELMGNTQSGISDLEDMRSIPLTTTLLRWARAVKAVAGMHIQPDDSPT